MTRRTRRTGAGRGVLLFFVLIWAAVTAAAPCAGAELVQDGDLPVVMDRATFPENYADFQFPEDAKILEIWFPDIRDADAAVLIYDGKAWMIDCGGEKAGARCALMITQLGIREIDKLFNTHPHHDHLMGLSLIDDVARVNELLICFPEDSTETMISALQVAAERDIPVTTFGDEDTFSMGDGQVTFKVWMKSREELSINDRSAQILVSYGDRKMLFMADMERPGQRDLAAAVPAEELKVDVFKYPHHGKLEMADELLTLMDPDMAIITNYRRYGKSFYYLGRRGVNMLYTNRDSVFLRVATDGEHWVCEYVPIKQMVPVDAATDLDEENIAENVDNFDE